MQNQKKKYWNKIVWEHLKCKTAMRIHSQHRAFEMFSNGFVPLLSFFLFLSIQFIRKNKQWNAMIARQTLSNDNECVNVAKNVER